MKLVFVCLGNICRSPLAEGVMRHLITDRGLDWHVDSAGTGGWHAGEPPDRRAIAIARKHGINISDLRARKFRRADFAEFDRIYALDPQNLEDILLLAKTEDEHAKVELFLNAAFPGTQRGVTDPWYDDTLFEPVYREIYEACEEMVQRLSLKG